MIAGHTWYADQSIRAADRFYEEIFRILPGIQDSPALYPQYLYGTQRALLNHYPFSVIYREILQEIQIIAVAHAKRRPGYWAARV